MEKSKTRRKTVRGLFTRQVNDCEKLFSARPLDKTTLAAKLVVITGHHESLLELNQKIQDDLYDEEDEAALVEECGMCDEYNVTFQRIKRRIEEAVAPPLQNDRGNGSPPPSASGSTNHLKNYSLPKLKLRQFSGDLLDWLPFMSHFKVIHEDDDLPKAVKFAHLLESLKLAPEAYALVEPYSATDANYDEVMEKLINRYGKNDVQLQEHVRKLLKMQMEKSSDDFEKQWRSAAAFIRNLKTLKLEEMDSDTWLYLILEAIVPEEMLLDWQRCSDSKKDGKQENPPKTKLDYFREFIDRELEARLCVKLAKTGLNSPSNAEKPPTSPKPKQNKRNEKSREGKFATAAELLTGHSTATCIFCENKHETKDCGKARSITLDIKEEKLKSARACMKCLKTGHFAKNCRVFVQCLSCGGRHQTIMCYSLQPASESTYSNKNEESQTESLSVGAKSFTPVATTNASQLSIRCTNEVIMKTLLVKVKCNSTGRQKTVRLLFDEGSQRSSITSWLTKELGSKPVGGEMAREILADGSVTKFRKVNHHELTLQGLDDKNEIVLILREKPKIGGGFSRIPIGSWLANLQSQGVNLTDVSNIPVDRDCIDICIGSDYENLIKTGQRVNYNEELSAWKTILGWCLSGPLPTTNHGTDIIDMYCAEESIDKMWNLDVIGITDPITKLTEMEEESEALNVFNESTTRMPSGRYCVKLPWKAPPVDLPTNKNVALKRLEACTRKLEAKQLYEEYGELFKNWEQENFIEEVRDEPEKCHYLPHRPVFKESSTTPVRPVFDASCKTTRTPSLNDCLYKGPNCIELLPAVLMRFRKKRIGVVADIRKAFQMIEVREEDRDYLRFMWWESKNRKTKTFCHRRVVFGVNSSPFLLAAVINQHLSNQNEFKEKANIIKSGMYVDNLVTSVSTVQERNELREVSVNIFADAQMDLRQWECTLEKNSGIGQSTSGWCGLEIDKDDTKVLGILWNKRTDNLSLEVPNFTEEILTKRTVLSFISKIFDPLGLVSPALIIPKLIIQEAWIIKTAWDSKLNEENTEKFQHWVKTLDSLRNLSIPRHHQINQNAELEIHTFTDASKDAYACVVYLKSKYKDEVMVQLLCAKARVAPFQKEKRPTIPRLELMGCLIGARLTAAVKKALEYEEVPTHYWSDSSTAIAWIKRNENWGTFVGNRVKAILQLTSADQWIHVPGKMNPADLPSRGCTPAELLESQWWEGPNWLRQKENWPSEIEKVDEEEVDEERRVTGSAMASTLKTSCFKTLSYMKNVKTIAWWKRFIEYIVKKKIPESRFLKINELREAESSLIRLIQSDVDHKNLDKFVIVEGSDGIKRVKTSVVNRPDTVGFCWPILLPGKHPIVRELIMECHRAYCHAGTQFLMGKLREKYWITQTRKTISNVLHHCVRCQRYIVKNAKVETAPLPVKRVQDGEVFSTTGVDLAGPLFLKDGSKVWIVLFTCAVYRCVALDLVRSLDTASFIQALERFVSVYGRPTNLFSDNGTNFVGAKNIFKDLDWEILRKQLATRQIQWTFNPPSAPWWGGFWERMVRSTKELLRRMLGKAKLTFEELRTILQSVAATINNRPLTTVTEDPNDLQPLTPAMFLIGSKGTCFPEGDITADTLRGQYEKIRVLRTALNARFRKEYLAVLTRKPVKETSGLKVGQIVLVGADNRKRFDWPLGRILEFKKGTDGKERTVVVKVAGGTLIGPVQRIYPLELPEGLPIEKTEIAVTQNNEEEELEESEHKHTKSGRTIKKPVRYGTWNK